MFRLPITIVICLTCVQLMALDGTIEGKIVSDKEKEPLAFVSVNLNETTGTLTNEDGYFKFRELEEGDYIVSLQYIGYDKLVKENIHLDESNPSVNLGTLTLEERASQIQEVTITHLRSEFSERYNNSNSLVSKQQLDRIQPIGTEEILKNVPGVNVAGDMGISNRLNVGIRGSYPRRSDKILILEDGTPVAPAPYLAPSAYYNPPTDRLDGIEIIKGADIVTYGPNTMYGVVNYITRKPPQNPTLRLNLTGGQHGYLSGLVSYGGTWKNVGAEAQVLYKQFDGFTQNSGSEIFNSTVKLFADLGEKQSVYVKLNYHQEKSNATYSSITPLTFSLDPVQNPFDADDLLTKRIAADLIHTYAFSKKVVLRSKVYAHQFTRDWWRQNTTLKKASEVQEYVGDEIFNDRYSYLQNQVFTDDDYVRVGKVIDGYESTKARNRAFNVTGWNESLKLKYGEGRVHGEVEIGLQLHHEKFGNQEIKNDSSRFARSGSLILDHQYNLLSGAAYIKESFTVGKFTVSPVVRFEAVKMTKQDLLAAAQNPNHNGGNFDEINNAFLSILPGGSASFKVIDEDNSSMKLFAGLHKGYTPPTSSAGFLSVTDDEVSSASTDDPLNMKPETSLSMEAGFRGTGVKQSLSGQLVYFNNHIKNFYSAGRKEAFESLGSVRISGLEAGLTLDVMKLANVTGHSLKIQGNATWIQSRITSGQLKDSDLLKAKHNTQTRQELIEKINNETGLKAYSENGQGELEVITGTLDADDFDNIEAVEMIFGEDGLEANEAPYIPAFNMGAGLSYAFKGLVIGGNFHLTGEQYTDYLNLSDESNDGALGKLESYATVDAHIQYSFKHVSNKHLNGLTLFFAGKNLTNQVYNASRLHRVSSGIFPAGFRQLNGGLKFEL